MVSLQKNTLVLFAALFLLQHSSIVSSKLASHDNGFTIDLIHRDSPSSPLYNSSANKYDIIGAAIRRSISRINHFNTVSSLSISPNSDAPVLPAGGSYIMNISIGTPPKPFMGIADTGSDLIWTQCKPCTSCYKQQLPIFDPTSSKTYKPSSCEAKTCTVLGDNYRGCSKDNTCLYAYAYGDQSQTIGELAFETLTFDESTSIDDVLFGCGHQNSGTFGEEGSGLIGLGGGPVSLVRQMKSEGSKFAYCLIPYDGQALSDSSKITFGSKAIVSGSGVASTPLIDLDPPTFYYLTLESITVGKGTSLESKKIPAPKRFGAANQDGNIIIDSGTTLTFLPSDMYESLEDALQEAIKGEQVQDPQQQLQLCYINDNSLKIPTITASFAGGADIELSPINTFIATSDDVVCLAIIPSDDLAIFGNISQMDFLVGYDLDEKTVSFKPTDCKKYV